MTEEKTQKKEKTDEQKIIDMLVEQDRQFDNFLIEHGHPDCVLNIRMEFKNLSLSILNIREDIEKIKETMPSENDTLRKVDLMIDNELSNLEIIDKLPENIAYQDDLNELRELIPMDEHIRIIVKQEFDKKKLHKLQILNEAKEEKEKTDQEIENEAERKKISLYPSPEMIKKFEKQGFDMSTLAYDYKKEKYLALRKKGWFRNSEIMVLENYNETNGVDK